MLKTTDLVTWSKFNDYGGRFLLNCEQSPNAFNLNMYVCAKSFGGPWKPGPPRLG